jgi:hypothetical protein
VFDRLDVPLADLLLELEDLLVTRTDQAADLLVVHLTATGTRESHLLFPEPSGAHECEGDDRHHQGDRGETAGR